MSPYVAKIATLFLTCFDTTTFWQNLVLKWWCSHFSCQNEAGLCALDVFLWENLVLVVLVQESELSIVRGRVNAQNVQFIISSCMSLFFLILTSIVNKNWTSPHIADANLGGPCRLVMSSHSVFMSCPLAVEIWCLSTCLIPSFSES